MRRTQTLTIQTTAATTVLLCLFVLAAPLTLAFQPSYRVYSPSTLTPTGDTAGVPCCHSSNNNNLGRHNNHCRCRNSISLALTTDPDGADSSLSFPMAAVSSIGATTSILVAGTFYLVLAWQRNAFMVAFFMGSIANGILSKVLKRIINQSRPPELDDTETTIKPSDGGMPSSHAMSLGYIGTITALHVSWAPLPVLVYVVVSLWYRVQVKLHTTAQIVVGPVVGAAHALIFDNYLKEGVMEWLRQYVLDSQGLLPLPLLVVPAIVGALVVGSVERRISHWLAQRRQEKEE